MGPITGRALPTNVSHRNLRSFPPFPTGAATALAARRPNLSRRCGARAGIARQAMLLPPDLTNNELLEITVPPPAALHLPPSLLFDRRTRGG